VSLISLVVKLLVPGSDVRFTLPLNSAQHVIDVMFCLKQTCELVQVVVCCSAEHSLIALI